MAQRSSCLPWNNVVERCFNFVKQWRGLASRYDKTARSYAAGLCLSAAL
ncbi:MAG TPA: transposase, partial [Candidatus Agrococcus pullicola]|nr:transposase [Candidatus Agrococcus pullicola]